MKTNTIKYDDYRNERAKNYGKALGIIGSIKCYHKKNLAPHIIETIEAVLNRCNELDEMEVDYSWELLTLDKMLEKEC